MDGWCRAREKKTEWDMGRGCGGNMLDMLEVQVLG